MPEKRANDLESLEEALTFFFFAYNCFYNMMVTCCEHLWLKFTIWVVNWWLNHVKAVFNQVLTTNRFEDRTRRSEFQVEAGLPGRFPILRKANMKHDSSHRCKGDLLFLICFRQPDIRKTRWSPRTRMPRNRDLTLTGHNFQQTHLWNTLTWHTQVTLLWDTLAWHYCATLW